MDRDNSTYSAVLNGIVHLDDGSWWYLSDTERIVYDNAWTESRIYKGEEGKVKNEGFIIKVLLEASRQGFTTDDMELLKEITEDGGWEDLQIHVVLGVIKDHPEILEEWEED